MCARSLLLLAVGLLSMATAAGAQAFGQPLTAEQVACEERQLERLVHRMVAGFNGSNLFLWRSSPGGGLYRGLASTSELRYDFDGVRYRKEVQLAFDLLFKADEDFIDPRRPRLPQATLVRRDAASNVHPTPPDRPYIGVYLDVAPEVPDPTRPGMLLRITGDPAVGADDRAGRGIAIADFLSACHGEISAFDLAVYQLLARTVRVSQCLSIGNCFAGLNSFKSTIFRGVEPLSYRMNVVSYLVACYDDGHCSYGESRTALLFRFQIDPAGRLIGGTAEALPWCLEPTQTSCSRDGNPGFAVFVMPPMTPGGEPQGEPAFQRAARLELEFEGSESNILYTTINWVDLLQGTTWSGGLVAGPGAPGQE